MRTEKPPRPEHLRLQVLAERHPVDDCLSPSYWGGEDHQGLEVVGDAEPRNEREPADDGPERIFRQSSDRIDRYLGLHHCAPMGEAYMYDPWVMMSSGWLTPAPTKPTLGTALPQWFALCALKTASSSPIKVVGGGGGKTTPLKMHCGHAVGDRPPGSALKVFTVRCPPK